MGEKRGMEKKQKVGVIEGWKNMECLVELSRTRLVSLDVLYEKLTVWEQFRKDSYSKVKGNKWTDRGMKKRGTRVEYQNEKSEPPNR